MQWHALVKSAERFTVNNSPAILTAIAVGGALTTAFLTGKASFKAAEILAEEETVLDRTHSDEDFERIFTFKYKFDHVWKLYIPAAGSAALTVTAIIMSHRISSRRAAAMAAAFAISERAFEEYRTKVVDKLGEKKERAVRDEIAQDRVNRNPVNNSTVIVTGEGDVLCYDDYTGRYFKSSVAKLRKAENDINHQIIHDHYASLTDLYDKIGLEQTGISEQLGWNLDYMLELDITGTISKDDVPCLHVSYKVCPALDRFRCL